MELLRRKVTEHLGEVENTSLLSADIPNKSVHHSSVFDCWALRDFSPCFSLEKKPSQLLCSFRDQRERMDDSSSN